MQKTGGEKRNGEIESVSDILRTVKAKEAQLLLLLVSCFKEKEELAKTFTTIVQEKRKPEKKMQIERKKGDYGPSYGYYPSFLLNSKGRDRSGSAKSNP